MRHNKLLLGALVFPLTVSASTMEDTPVDTSRVYDIEEAVVVASPKEHTAFRHQPVSASVFGTKDMALHHIEAMKNLSAFAPNVYMPNYGSRFTSAIYVRGVGSRINTPAVGLYVDNIPFADKACYDFSFLDIDRIDLLRGPQGTLYGRGSMSGLMRVFTADPSRHNGTTVRLGASGPDTGRRISATTFLHPAQGLDISLSGLYAGSAGFFRNTTTGRKADGSNEGGGRFRAVWRANDRLRFDFSSAYLYSDENSNPYYYLGSTSASEPYPYLLNLISQNRQSSYRRGLFHTGLNVEYKAKKFTFSAITSYLHLRDRLFMDQDYIRADIFSLEQRQRMNSVSEELNFKGSNGRHWAWTTGAFFLYENKRTTCPVNFYAGGVDFLNSMFRSVMPSFVTLQFTDSRLPFDASLKTPGMNVALFHQSTFHHFLLEGLSLTAGLRLDYDRHALTLNSPARPYNYLFQLQMPTFGLDINQSFTNEVGLAGKSHHGSWQLIPKVALQYDLPSGIGNVYWAVSKGYRSGGYNLENYSDLAQNLLRRNIMGQVRDYSIATLQTLPSLTEESREKAIAGMSGMIAANMPGEVSVSALAYKPEYSWNHELGTHLTLFEGALQLDAAAFLLSTHHLQMARFSPSGMGREIVNAGRSRTYGVELSVRSSLLDNRLSLQASYGWAHSTFTQYFLGLAKGATHATNYKGNFVPYAPEHTLAASADFRQPLSNAFFEAFTVGAEMVGAGRIWWDEANTFSSPFHAVLNAHAGVELAGKVSVDFWARNLTKAHYREMSFISMSRRYAQYTRPLQVGIDVKIDF